MLSDLNYINLDALPLRDTLQKPMAHWKLTLAYDGTGFHGWQVQPRLRTVQGTLAQAVYAITGETVLPQGSGRTDTGVHALGQVASFSLRTSIPARNLLRAINRKLPPAIRVLDCMQVPPGFHARHDALRKTYEYRIFPRVPIADPEDPEGPAGGIGSAATFRWNRTDDDRICPPTLAPYAWDCPSPIVLARAAEAARHVVGEHDFTSFAAADPDQAARRLNPKDEAASNIRTIFRSEWCREHHLLVYRVTGSGFLHHMVRNLVGTFVEVASGRRDPASIPRVMTARDRQAAGVTAPPQGLFLVSVEYPQLPAIFRADYDAAATGFPGEKAT